MAKPNIFKVSGFDKFLALLSYLNILFLIPLFAKKDDNFIYPHAKQGFVFFLFNLVGLLFLFGVPYIPLPNYFVSVLIWVLYTLVLLFNLLLFIYWIIAIVMVFMGRTWKMPWVWKIAKKL